MSDKIRVPLADATPEQMREFATERLGLQLGPNPNIKPETLRAKIAAKWDLPDIDVRADQAGPPKGDQIGNPPVNHEFDQLTGGGVAPGGNDPLVRIEIAPQEGPGGDQPVFVAVNNRAIWLPRGEPIRVKYKYFEVLKNAKTRIGEQIAEKDGGGIRWKDIQSYPFTVLEMPPQAEINAWLAKDAGHQAAA